MPSKTSSIPTPDLEARKFAKMAKALSKPTKESRK